MRRRAAFTLIELMVAIGIVLVISAIVLPVYAQAKGAARRTECLSNVRQITAATLMYMEENGDIPMGRSLTFGSWLSLVGLESDRGPTMKCPLHTTRFLANPQNIRASGYVLNACMIRSMRPFWPQDESKTVLVAEKGTIYAWSGLAQEESPEQFPGPDCLWYSPRIIREGGHVLDSAYGCRRHLGGANYGILDGRTVWRRPEEIRFYAATNPCMTSGPGRWLGPSTGITYQILDIHE